jgi:hypothetical protein
MVRLRRPALICTLAALAVALPAGTSRGDLAGQLAAGQQRVGALQSSIHADDQRIQGYSGRIGDLQARLSVIESSLAIQQQQLRDVRMSLIGARLRQGQLAGQYAADRSLLAAQLVADYESPPPDLIDAIVESRGFEDLLNKVDDLRTIAKANARATRLVNSARIAVAAQAVSLAQVEARRRRATASVLVERDQLAQLRLSIVNSELAVQHDRDRKSNQLSSLQRKLAKQAAVLDQQAVNAESEAAGTGAPPPGGCINAAFVAHGGQFGFFQAAGTNYSVGEEPVIAARLDALGKSLQLHLIGISGYRTPQHSVEVGGFADDPHTRGIASDTPGVEGVPEATLEEFCLTRPFPGPREADHIQEL